MGKPREQRTLPKMHTFFAPVMVLAYDSRGKVIWESALPGYVNSNAMVEEVARRLGDRWKWMEVRQVVRVVVRDEE